MQLQRPISFLRFGIRSVLNSYALLFFSRNRLFALLILLTSFFNPFSGISGLFALVTSMLLAGLLGFNREHIETGIYTYPALLVGLGFGFYFEFGIAFFILLISATLLTILLSVVLTARLGRQSLPALSLSFIFSTWVIILAVNQFNAIGLTQRHIYWVSHAYETGGMTLVNLIQRIEDIPMPAFFSGFFRSMSAIIFQLNMGAGILLTIGVLFYSRIAFLLMWLGYTVAFLFQQVMHSGDVTSYYNLGTNYMLVAVAVGGLYVIPSLRSFIWAALLVPVSYLLVVGIGKVTQSWGLPVFSLPFCVVVITYLYSLKLRVHPGKLVLTPVQYFSPEQNLYRYLNSSDRQQDFIYFPLQLPVLGEWMVSQGYKGQQTHKGEWAQALDFVILDHEMKTYQNPGNRVEHFYCFNKPVLAPGDGIIETVIDYIPDNEVGFNNVAQNWGNSIVIKHADGLYSKLSHLRQHSIKVVKGQFVQQGEILALCGNSGRSPEPHLHFQLQRTPYVGSKTIAYPFALVESRKDNRIQLNRYTVPKEGTFVRNLQPNRQWTSVFSFQPGLCVSVQANGWAMEEWEVKTSAYNETYFYCEATRAAAYFVARGQSFYFTNYFGTRQSLLFYFYQAAYRFILSNDAQVPVEDHLPVNLYARAPWSWLQDMVAPFFIFSQHAYRSCLRQSMALLSMHSADMVYEINRITGNTTQAQAKGVIRLTEAGEIMFTYQDSKQNIQATCRPNSSY